MKPTRICLVLPSLAAGGMERVMSELAHFFADQNCEVHLVTLTKGDAFYLLDSNINDHEPSFYFNRKFRIYYTLKTISYLRRKLKSIMPDSVLSFGEMHNSFVLFSAMGLKLKIYVSDRTMPFKKWGIFHELLRRLIYSKAKGIICQTSDYEKFLASITQHKNIKVIPNPVRIVSGIKNDRRNIVLFVGRLISTKRVDILLELFAQIHLPDWELWIVGDGPLNFALNEQSQKIGISEKVTFWGNQRDIGKFYQQAKIFAFPSTSEGFPNSLLEAMAWGLGCIAFDCKSGPSDLIKDNYNGFLIPILNKGEFQNRLKLLQTDESILKKLSENAVLTSMQYSLDKVGREYLDFITK